MFSFKKLAKHHTTGVLKDHIEAKQYIEKFFYPLTNGEHAMRCCTMERSQSCKKTP